MQKILKVFAYIGLFFLLGAPIWVGFGIAALSGVTSYVSVSGAAHGVSVPMLSPSIIYGIIFEVPWLMVLMFVTWNRFIAPTKP